MHAAEISGLINIMNSVYRGWVGGRDGRWGRWGAEGGFFHIFEQKSSHCVH